MARPRKIQFPIGLDDFLRVILRGKRPEDRMKIFREFIRYDLRRKIRQEPTDSEVEDQLRRWQNAEIHGFDLPFIDNLRFDFLPIYHKENRSKRGRTAAIKRWDKKKKKTS
jgi:hypothetical protein